MTFRATSTHGTADTTLDFIIYSIPVWSALSAVTWTVDTVITDIDLNDSCNRGRYDSNNLAKRDVTSGGYFVKRCFVRHTNR